MKALSLRQPWAWVVLHLGKTLENRRWTTSFRGDFLIHASSGMTAREYYECVSTCVQVCGTEVLGRFPPLKALPRGAIVGAARLVDVLPRCPRLPCEHPWHMLDPDLDTGQSQYGLMLDHVRPAPRIVVCKGTLGFWRVPDAVARELTRGDLSPSSRSSTGGSVELAEEARRS